MVTPATEYWKQIIGELKAWVVFGEMLRNEAKAGVFW